MEENEEGSLGTLPAIKIHDDDVILRFLVCGEPSTLVSLYMLVFPAFKYLIFN